MKRYFRQFKLVYSDKSEKKGLLKILKEIIVLSYKKKEPALYYGGKYLYRKEITNPADYLSIKEFFKIVNSDKLHKKEYTDILKDKFKFSRFCSQKGLPSPNMYSYNEGDQFYFKDERFLCRDKKDIIGFFEKVFAATGAEYIFLKRTDAQGGKGCHKIAKVNLQDQLAHIDLVGNSYIHQQIIEQHDAINAIYPYSVNSIRFITYIDALAEAQIISAFMRFGIGGSFVDNASAGGFYVAIDLDHGTLEEKGHQSMRAGGGLFYKHPDTSYIYKGFKIPFFEEACALVLEAVKQIPDRFVGWDIGITPNGPILIEGNENPGMQTADIAYGGYLKHPKIREMMAEI